MERKRHKTRYPGVMYRERPDGSRQHMIWYVGTDGKPRWENTPGGLKEAVQARARIVDRINHGHHVAPSKLKLGDWATQWLEEKSNIRPKTYKTYEGNIRCHIIPRLGRHKVCDLSVNHVAALIADMRSEGYSAATINAVTSPLSGMMRTAVRRGLAAQNPVAQLDRHERPQGARRRMEILDSNEIRLFLSNAGNFHVLLATAIFTGLRMSELLNLRWEDVDWEAGVLKVRDSKTKSGIREVVLMDSLRKLLASHSLEHGESEWVFHTRTGKRLNPAGVRRDGLLPALKKCELGKHVRFHDLRHTFASILIDQGLPDTYIAEQMGHTSAAFTRRIYGHLFDREERRKKAREIMESQFGEVLS